MSDSRKFDDLPPEVKGIIWDFINEKNDMTSSSSVASEWNRFFHSQIVVQHLLDFLANDQAACKKINIDQLSQAVDLYCRKTNPQRNADLFIALKKLESQIIDIEMNPDRTEEKKLVKISRQALQPLLVNRFGLAGLIHSRSVHDARSGETFMDGLVPFLVLEKLMQQNSQKYGVALELINLLGKHHIFWEGEEDSRKESSVEFYFADNQLHMKEKSEGLVEDHLLSEEVQLSFDPQNIAVLQQKNRKVNETAI